MRSVWLAQVNSLYGNQAFLPYSVGLLQAYAQQFPEIQENYDFKGFVYIREPVDELAEKMGLVDVLGVSCYIWNFTYSMALAKAVKKVNPNCLIVLGGPHVPTRFEGFFGKHPYVDVLVHHEGEKAFVDILRERLEGKDQTHSTVETERITNLEEVPSPYLMGVFDYLMKGGQPYAFHATQETHRGCPFQLHLL